MRARLIATAAASGVLVTACAAPPSGSDTTLNDCVVAILAATADSPDLDEYATGVSCAVTRGPHAGSVVAPGRSHNVVRVVDPTGAASNQIAGTYLECQELLVNREVERCLTVDGPLADREIVQVGSGQVGSADG